MHKLNFLDVIDVTRVAAIGGDHQMQWALGTRNRLSLSLVRYDDTRASDRGIELGIGERHALAALALRDYDTGQLATLNLRPGGHSRFFENVGQSNAPIGNYGIPFENGSRAVGHLRQIGQRQSNGSRNISVDYDLLAKGLRDYTRCYKKNRTDDGERPHGNQFALNRFPGQFEIIVCEPMSTVTASEGALNRWSGEASWNSTRICFASTTIRR